MPGVNRRRNVVLFRPVVFGAHITVGFTTPTRPNSPVSRQHMSSTGVVDGRGRLIAHPDISLVLRDTNLSKLPQVAAALSATQARDSNLQSPSRRGRASSRKATPPKGETESLVKALSLLRGTEGANS